MTFFLVILKIFLSHNVLRDNFYTEWLRLITNSITNKQKVFFLIRNDIYEFKYAPKYDVDN